MTSVQKEIWFGPLQSHKQNKKIHKKSPVSSPKSEIKKKKKNLVDKLIFHKPAFPSHTKYNKAPGLINYY